MIRSLVPAVLCLSLLTGCWDRKELNDLSLVTGVAVDKGKSGKYRLSIEVLNPIGISPRKSIGDSAPSIIFSLEGDSLAELSRKMNVGFSRNLIYSHMRTAVIDEELAKQGMIDFLDFFERDREIREDFNILIAHNISAEDVLKLPYPMQKDSSLKIHKQLDTLFKDWGGDPDVRLRDFLDSYTSTGKEPVLAIVGLSQDPQNLGYNGNMKRLVPNMVTPIGMAIFRGLKMQGSGNLEDVRSYLWTQGKIHKTMLTVQSEDNKFVDVRILNSYTDIKVQYRDDAPYILVHLKLEGMVNGTQAKVDFGEIDSYQELQILVNNMVAKQVEATIKKAQALRTDIFGFGEAMAVQDSNHFEKVKDRWNEEFAEAIIEVKVDTDLERSGIIGKSFLIQKADK